MTLIGHITGFYRISKLESIWQAFVRLALAVFRPGLLYGVDLFIASFI